MHEIAADSVPNKNPPLGGTPYAVASKKLLTKPFHPKEFVDVGGNILTGLIILYYFLAISTEI